MDLAILNLLRQNARYSYAELSRKLRIPGSSARLRCQKLTVLKYTSLIDPARLGFPLRKLVLATGDWALLAHHTSTNSLWRVKPGRFLSEHLFPDLAAVERFRHDLARKVKIEKEIDVLEVLQQEKFTFRPAL